MNQTLEGMLEQGIEVSLLAMNTARHWVELSELPDLYSKLAHFDTVYINNSINPFSAFINLFTDKSYNVNRFVNKQFEKKLLQLLLLNDYDYVWFDSIYTSPYVDLVAANHTAKRICRVHNIEHHIWQNLTEHEPAFFKKKYLSLLTERLKKYELDILKRFDFLLPISASELDFLHQHSSSRIYLLPFGVDTLKHHQEYEMEYNSCYHIGSMDWGPNIEGVTWFLDEVWPGVLSEIPGISFYIAGKNMPASIYSRQSKQVKVLGEIDDFNSFSLQKNIMIVPLRSGAGIRIKILEAMQLGKTILSTSIGAEGLGLIDHETVFIADDKDTYVAILKKCFSDPALARRIGDNAKEFVHSRYNKQELYHNLHTYLSDHKS